MSLISVASVEERWVYVWGVSGCNSYFPYREPKFREMRFSQSNKGKGESYFTHSIIVQRALKKMNNVAKLFIEK